MFMLILGLLVISGISLTLAIRAGVRARSHLREAQKLRSETESQLHSLSDALRILHGEEEDPSDPESNGADEEGLP